MQQKLVLFCVLLGFLFVHCDSEDDNMTNPLCDPVNELKTVTGIQFLKDDGSDNTAYGNPNDISATDRGIAAFPNPADNEVFLTTSNTGGIRAFWLMPADCPFLCRNQDFDIEYLTDNIYREEESNLDGRSTISGELDVFLTQLVIDLRSVDNGSYKLIIKMDSGEIVWQNLIVHHDLRAPEDIIEYIENLCM